MNELRLTLSLIAFFFLQGVRASTVDPCENHNPCQNGGICISTDGGPICECSYIDFDGFYCEQSKLIIQICLKCNPAGDDDDDKYHECVVNCIC